MARIVVTGCSRGIGWEIVRQAAAAGHSVLALSRNIEPLRDLHPGVQAHSWDLAETSTDKGIQSALELGGPIDALIHNAGLLINKPFAELTDADIEASYRVNVLGVARLTRLALPWISREGHVVGISSMGGVQGSAKFAGLSAYSSSKAALIGWIELWAEEYKDSGPSFNALALGAVQTEMLAQAFPGYQAPVTAEAMGAYVLDFALTGHRLFNGKVLQVSKSVP